MALAPAIAALVGIGVAVLWRDRASRSPPGSTLAAVVALTAGWAFVLLRQTTWLPWLAWAVPSPGSSGWWRCSGVHRLPRAAVVGVATVALVAGAGGPTAYALATAATPHTGAIPSAGPAGAGGMRGPGGMRGGGTRGDGRGPGGSAPRRTAPGRSPDRDHEQRPTADGTGRGGGMGGPGGLLGSPTPSAELTALLQATPAPTPGSPPPSAPTPPPATSSRPRRP